MPSHQNNDPPVDPAAAKKEKNRIAVAKTREKKKQEKLQWEERKKVAEKKNKILNEQIPKMRDLISFMEKAVKANQERAEQQQSQASASVFHQPPADPQLYVPIDPSQQQFHPTPQAPYYAPAFQQPQPFPLNSSEGFYPYRG